MITIHTISNLSDVMDFLHELAEEVKLNGSTLKDADEIPTQGYTESQCDYRYELLSQCWKVCDSAQVDLDTLLKKVVGKVNPM
jgi:hypothetical protein